MNNQCGKSCSVELLSNTVMRVLTLPSNDWSEAPNPHAAGYCSWIGSASKTWTSSRWDVDGRPLQSCLRWHTNVKSLTPEGLLFPPRVMRAGFSLTKISNVVMAFLCFRACQTLLVSQDKRCSPIFGWVSTSLGCYSQGGVAFPWAFSLKGNTMTLVLVACCISGYMISRPLVRAFGL